MSEIIFWKDWRPSYKLLLYIVGGGALAGIFYALVAWYLYPSSVFPETVYQEIASQIFTYREVVVGQFTLAVPAENSLLFEHANGEAPRYSPAAFYAFLFIFALSVSTLLSIATTLKRLWFIGSAGLFILLAAALHLEALSPMGLSDRTPLIVFLSIYLLPAFYLHHFKPGISLLTRWLFFATLTGGVAGLVAWTAQTPHPGLILASYSLLPGMLICFLFILLVGHEYIVFFIAYVQSATEHGHLKHIFILSVTYVAYLLVLYLQQAGYLVWRISTLDMLFLFLGAALLGCWGYQRREPLYAAYFKAQPEGVLIYLSLFAISGACYGFYYGVGNDVGVDLMSRWTLYTQLGCGVIFLVYLISNFSPLLFQNAPLHKILYKPNTMPWFTFRIMSAMATYAFWAYDISFAQFFNQSVGGYYNNIATAYYVQADYDVASAYYKHAANRQYLNHQAHYALAILNAQQGDVGKEKSEYALAALPDLAYKSTEAAFLNAGDIYARYGDIGEAINLLKAGLRKLPDNGKLYNALGLLYRDQNDADSALYYFAKAHGQRNARRIGATNLVGMKVQAQSAFPIDSLWMSLDTDDEGICANIFAMGNLQKQTLSMTLPALSDTVLTASRAALYANYLLNHASTADTTLLNQLGRLIESPDNLQFQKRLSLPIAYAYYEQGYTRKAIALLRKIAYLTQSGFYNKILGFWSLEKRNPQGALLYFQKAANDEREDAVQIQNYIALAEMECDSLPAAVRRIQNTKTELPFAAALLRALDVSEYNVLALSDEDKYAFLRYRSHRYDTAVFWRVWHNIVADEWKAKAVVNIVARLIDAGQYADAALALRRAQGLSLRSKDLLAEIQRLNLLLVALNKNWPVLRQALAHKKMEGSDRVHRLFYEGLLLQADNQAQLASEKFIQLLQEDLTNAAIVGTAAEVLYEMPNLPPQSIYETLVEALLQQPYAVPLLKVYILASIRMDIGAEAIAALDRLKILLPPAQYNQYIDQHPKAFSVVAKP